MKLLPLNKGMFSEVSDDDFDDASLLKWYEDQGYVYHCWRENGKMHRISLHRWLLKAGPEDTVDHRDGDGLNNQRNNIRLCTDAENLRNKKLSKTSTTGWKGVTYERNRNSFKASIKFNGKSYNLGRYKNPIDAAKAYNDGAIKYFGDFAWLNKFQEE